MTEQERKQGARAAADSTLRSGAFRGVLLGLCGAALLGGCAVTSEPEAGAYGTLHTGLESKKDGVDFHAAPSGKSWAGLEGGWTFENDLAVGVALEGTLNRSSKTFGKNDVPFDRQANLSFARGEERLVVGRSKMMGRKLSMTSSISKSLGSLADDYPIEPMELRPAISETLASSVYWQGEAAGLPVRAQYGTFDAGRYGALEAGWEAEDLQGALLYENTRAIDAAFEPIESLSAIARLDDPVGWSAIEVWGTRTEGELFGTRMTRAFENEAGALRFSCALGRQSNADLASTLFDEELLVGEAPELWTLEGLLRLNASDTLNATLQTGTGVLAETPAEGAVTVAETFSTAPVAWLTGLGFERRYASDAAWSVSASLLRAEAPDELPYTEWGARTLWEIPLAGVFSTYVGAGLGQGGFADAREGWAEWFVGVGASF